MQLDTALKRHLFFGFIILVFLNILLFVQCNIYNERIDKKEDYYNERIYQLQKEVHTYRMSYLN